jgi:hypothetical protein
MSPQKRSPRQKTISQTQPGRAGWPQECEIYSNNSGDGNLPVDVSLGAPGFAAHQPGVYRNGAGADIYSNNPGLGNLPLCFCLEVADFEARQSGVYDCRAAVDCWLARGGQLEARALA